MCTEAGRADRVGVVGQQRDEGLLARRRVGLDSNTPSMRGHVWHTCGIRVAYVWHTCGIRVTHGARIMQHELGDDIKRRQMGDKSATNERCVCVTNGFNQRGMSDSSPGSWAVRVSK